jgi:hypothetical protein
MRAKTVDHFNVNRVRLVRVCYPVVYFYLHTSNIILIDVRNRKKLGVLLHIC